MNWKSPTLSHRPGSGRGGHTFSARHHSMMSMLDNDAPSEEQHTSVVATSSPLLTAGTPAQKDDKGCARQSLTNLADTICKLHTLAPSAATQKWQFTLNAPYNGNPTGIRLRAEKSDQDLKLWIRFGIDEGAAVQNDHLQTLKTVLKDALSGHLHTLSINLWDDGASYAFA